MTRRLAVGLAALVGNGWKIYRDIWNSSMVQK
jgi:hypothetical protein